QDRSFAGLLYGSGKAKIIDNDLCSGVRKRRSILSDNCASCACHDQNSSIIYLWHKIALHKLIDVSLIRIGFSLPSFSSETHALLLYGPGFLFFQAEDGIRDQAFQTASLKRIDSGFA